MLHFSYHRKRSVSEVQLMHNTGVQKHIQERQDWLQMKLRDIHTAAIRNSDRGRARKLLPEDLPDLLEQLSPGDVENRTFWKS